MDYEAKRIVVCLRYGIGDVVMELPVLDALRAAVPRAVGGTDIDCPHRNTPSLHPPGRWAAHRCLVAERGCIERASVEDAVASARRALAGATRRRPRTLPARAPGA